MDRTHPQGPVAYHERRQRSPLRCTQLDLQVDQISQDKESSRHATVIGRLVAGSLAYFAHRSSNGFTIKRDDGPERTGWVNCVGPTNDPTGTYLMVSLELLEDGRLRRGDLLRFRQQWVG